MIHRLWAGHSQRCRQASGMSDGPPSCPQITRAYASLPSPLRQRSPSSAGFDGYPDSRRPACTASGSAVASFFPNRDYGFVMPCPVEKAAAGPLCYSLNVCSGKESGLLAPADSRQCAGEVVQRAGRSFSPRAHPRLEPGRAGFLEFMLPYDLSCRDNTSSALQGLRVC